MTVAFSWSVNAKLAWRWPFDRGGIRRLSATTPTAATTTTTTTVRDGTPAVRPGDDPAAAGCVAFRRATGRQKRCNRTAVAEAAAAFKNFYTKRRADTLLLCTRKTVPNKRRTKQTSRYRSDLPADVCRNGQNETEKTCFFF